MNKYLAEMPFYIRNLQEQKEKTGNPMSEFQVFYGGA